MADQRLHNKTKGTSAGKPGRSGIKCAIWLTVTLAFMVFIFSMSAENGPQSSSLSGEICRKIGEIFVPGFKSESAAAQAAFIESITFAVRKAAHMTEYAILAILWCTTLGAFGVRGKKRVLIAFLIAFGYACTDEFHQRFVPGRGPSPIDVMIDSTGAVIGLLLRTLVLHLHERRRRKGSKSSGGRHQ